MIIDQITLDTLKDKYQVIDIESRCELPYAYASNGRTIVASDLDGEIQICLTHGGFERLIQDLHAPEKQTIDVRDVFAISPIEIITDKRCVYVATFSMEKYPVDVVVASGKKLLEALSTEGCTGIVLPDIFDISILTVEQLTQMRDNLTAMIQNMNYDNVMGFNKNHTT